MRVPTITNSSRCTFLSCPFSYYCEYILRLSPNREPVYFQWGSLVHAYAAAIENDVAPDKILSEVYKEIESRISYLSAPQLEEMEAMITILPIIFKVHTAKWGTTDANYESLNTEHKFSLAMDNGWEFQGKIDNVVRDIRDGRIYTWERKTAAKTGPTYWSRLPRDSQAKGYSIAARECWGFQTHGAIYDVFKKPAITRNKEESLTAYYARIATLYMDPKKDYMERGPMGGMDIKPIRYTVEQLEDYWADLHQVCEMINFCTYNAYWPKHCPGNRIGGCSFCRLCEDGINEQTLRNYRTREESHPELIGI